jgi:hypothetical protein
LSLGLSWGRQRAGVSCYREPTWGGEGSSFLALGLSLPVEVFSPLLPHGLSAGWIDPTSPCPHRCHPSSPLTAASAPARDVCILDVKGLWLNRLPCTGRSPLLWGQLCHKVTVRSLSRTPPPAVCGMIGLDVFICCLLQVHFLGRSGHRGAGGGPCCGPAAAAARHAA